MDATYPIYVLERDDFSIREFRCPKELLFCERPDVVDELYDGWDSTGRRLNVQWDDRRQEPTVSADDEPSLGAFSDVVERYCVLYAAYDLPPGSRRRRNPYDPCAPSYLRSQFEKI